MQTTTGEAQGRDLAAPELGLGHLAVVTAGKLGLNIAYRILYPLLPFLAARLQVDLQTASVLVTVQVAAALASPLAGALADTRGERAAMGAGLGMLGLGALICALSSSFAGFLAGYILIGLAVPLYQPAAQSYLSARTPYRRRGWVLGVMELSWAASALLGVAPLMLLVQRSGDVAPVFWALLLLALGTLLLLQTSLPPTPRAAGGPDARRRIDWGALRMPRVLGVLGMLALVMCGVDLILVVQGAWLKADFGADEAQLGQIFALMGAAELLGSLGATLLVDRIGKKRAVVGGYALTALAVLLLPLSGGSWLLLGALFFLFDLALEFSIIASFPLASGVAPGVRGTVMALVAAVIGGGRAVGSLISEPLWSRFGIGANSALAACLILLGVLLCLLFVRETEAERNSDPRSA
jgi:predicted MFS family arabinose efflux permease